MARPLKEPRTPFGKRLRIVRETHAVNIGDPDMKQPEFAALLGLGTTRYGNYEAGKREPDLMVLTKIQSLTHCDLNWLVTGKARREVDPAPQKATTETAIKLHRVQPRRA